MTTTTAAAAGTRVESTPLRREITRPMLTMFVIGDVLGAGIYALVGDVAGKVGGAIWTSFLLAGVLAAFTRGGRSSSSPVRRCRWRCCRVRRSRSSR